MKLLGRRKASDDAASASAPATARGRAAPRPAEGRRLRRRLLRFKDRTTDSLQAGNLRERFRRLERSLHLTRTGQIAVVAAIVPWAIAFVVAGKALYIFAYGTLFLVVTSYLLAPRNLKLEGVRAGLLPRAQQGDRLEVEVQLTAQKRVSTFILEERVPERLGRTVKVPVPRLGRDTTVRHRYSLRCQRRGVYEVGPLVAVTSDPLGLTERETVIADRFEMLVHPRVENVSDRPLTRRYEDPPIRPPVSKPWPSGLEFYGMREYQPGDELKRIVWRASARVGKLMVRQAEEGITDSITVVLDTDRGFHSRDGDYSESFETGVRAASSLAAKHLREGYEVRCEANQGPLSRTLRGSRHQLSLLDSFARVEMSREPLRTAIERLVADPRRDAHNIIVTPHLGDDEAARLRLLLNKGTSVLVIALLWEEDEGESRTLNVAAALGCQVAGVRPGDDLRTALYHDVGAGSR